MGILGKRSGMTEEDANRITAAYENKEALAEAADEAGRSEDAHNVRVEMNNLAAEAYSEAGGEVGEDRS